MIQKERGRKIIIAVKEVIAWVSVRVRGICGSVNNVILRS